MCMFNLQANTLVGSLLICVYKETPLCNEVGRTVNSSLLYCYLIINVCIHVFLLKLYIYVAICIWKLDRKIPMLCKWYFAISHLVITSFSLYYHMYALFDAVVHAPWGYRKWQEPGGGTFSTCLKLSLFVFCFFVLFCFFFVLFFHFM